jgi:toxin ParE1/3/4
MKRKLVMRPQADLDLINHCVYLAERQPRTATNFKQAVRASISAIASSPRTGAAMSLASFPDIELRFQRPGRFKRHLIIYQVTDDSVIVLRILHGSQDIEAALKP